MVTQRPLEALFMVRIHVGQPLKILNNHNGFLLLTGKIIDQLRQVEKAIKRQKDGILLTLLLTPG